MKSFIFLLTFISMVFSNSEFANETINKAQKFLDSKQYDSVVVITKAYLKKEGKSPETETIVPMLMKAEVALKNKAYFDKLKSKYIKKFPDSPKLATVYYLSGIANAQIKEFVDAITDLSVSEAYSTNDSEKELVRKNVSKIAKLYLNKTELELLMNESLSPITSEIINFYYALKVKDSDQAKGDSLINQFHLKWPNSPLNEDTVTVDNSVIVPLRDNGKFDLTVAIMVPLTGNNAKLGKSALNAAKMALDKHEKETGEKINYIVVDTKGNPIVTATKTKELIDRGVSVIVGPIMSNSATVAAAMLISHPEITMITPTATDDGIAALGKNIFQLNITTKALAEEIARYSVQDLGIKDFAILAPISDYGQLMSKYFSETVEKIGGTIKFTDYFNANAHDHNGQFTALRNKYAELKYGSKDSVHTLSQDQQKERESFLEDSTVVVGGLFVPSMADNIVKIAAEVPFYKIQTQLLGSNGWYNKKTIKEGGRYVDGGVFSAPYRVNINSDTWKTFSTSYNLKYGIKPGTVVEPLAYDAINLIINAKSNVTNRKDINQYLLSVKDYKGLSGTITINSKFGTNSSATIYKISSTGFIRLK